MRDPKTNEGLGYATETVKVFATDDYAEEDVRRVIAFLESVLSVGGAGHE